MDLSELEKDWNAWGRLDPLWAILSLAGKDKMRWNLDEFFNTGAEEIDSISRYVQSLGVSFPRGKALDFGCGVGRLTQALADRFDLVYGVDIATSMIKLANKYNRVPEKCRYLLNRSDDLSVFEPGYFDFIYSCRVLQHMEPRYCKKYIEEFIRVLSATGLLVFQEPAAIKEVASKPFVHSESTVKKNLKRILPAWLIKTYWQYKLDYMERKSRSQPKMEMYCISKDEMVELLHGLGARIIDVVEDDSAPGFVSLRYCVAKVK